MHYPEEVEGRLTREAPSESFLDYFSQARMFYNSLTSAEQEDLIDSFTYHLQYVESKSVREQNVEMWANVDEEFAKILADRLGVEHPQNSQVEESRTSPALSAANKPHSAATQKVGVLIGDGFAGEEVKEVLNTLEEKGAFVHIISQNLGTITGDDGTELEVQETFKMKDPVLYDAFYIVGGKAKDQEKFKEDIMYFYMQAYKFLKPIGVAESGAAYLEMMTHEKPLGIIHAEENSDFGQQFVEAIAQRRFWERK